MKIAAIVCTTIVCLFAASGCDIQYSHLDSKVYHRNEQTPRSGRKPPCGPKPILRMDVPPLQPQCVIIGGVQLGEDHGTTTTE